MLKVIQEVADEAKLLRLIPKMRRGEECSVVEKWFVQDCLGHGRGLTPKVMRLFQEIPEKCESPGDAWFRAAMLYFGIGVARNVAEAIEIVQPHQNDPTCAVLLGGVLLWSTMPDVPRGLALVQQNADADYAEGLFLLSYVYKEGMGVTKDTAQAYKLLHRAADLSHPCALNNLGRYFSNGIGVERNLQLGVHCYERAISLGCVDAVVNLGECYRDGKGVATDGRRAASLFRKAIVLGNDKARENLEKLPVKDSVPWGKWFPDPLMHDYVLDDMHHAIRTVLLMRDRRGSLFSLLPKPLALDICFWICTDPPQAPEEHLGVMNLQRQVNDLRHQLQHQQQMLQTILNKLS